MSADKGYIKLYRDIRDHWIWNTEPGPYSKLKAWVDLIMMANHEDRKVMFEGEPMLIKRGEMLTSIRKLSVRWGWSNRKTMRFLDGLERDGMVTQKRTAKCTVINLDNYCLYQDSRITKSITKASLKHHGSITDAHKQYTKKNEEGIEKNIGVPAKDETGDPWPEDMWEEVHEPDL